MKRYVPGLKIDTCGTQVENWIHFPEICRYRLGGFFTSTSAFTVPIRPVITSHKPKYK